MQRIQNLPSADPNPDPTLSPPDHPRVMPPALLLPSQMLQLPHQVPRQRLMPSSGSLNQRGMHIVRYITNLDHFAHNPRLTLMHAICTHPPSWTPALA